MWWSRPSPALPGRQPILQLLLGRPIRLRPPVLVALLLSCALLSACGFKLRGDQRFAFDSLHSGFGANSDMGAQFRRTVRLSESTRLVDQAKDAQARLEIIRELREKEIVGLSTSGRPREYQLRLRLSFKVLSALSDDPVTELMPETEIVLRRDVSTSDQQIVSKLQEEELLYREMQSDLVQQLMRRLAAVRMNPGTAASKK
jgi:LPS-assembly lipoprotein